ncbi:MAG: SAM-dependent methyltransferase [Sulfurovum sp.]|nr:MAG: SAM-dependent methyltransferase [Sulfurovum sp.]
MKLENIVPWGRNLAEYKAMFLLNKDDLNAKILGCGDGPSSFNTEVDLEQGSVISIDPLYAFSKQEIMQRIDDVSDEVMEQVKKHQDDFVWKNIPDPDTLYQLRIEAMMEFLMDYNEGKEEGRYIAEVLPKLSFEDNQFDLALSSHFLFLYSEHLDEEFHIKSILEMLRVAKEVRVFPLIDLKGEKSVHTEGVIKELTELGYNTSIIKTEYGFQKGGDEMLKITKG